MANCILFKDSYFDGQIVCDIEEAKQIIKNNPSNSIRVQMDDFRLLLHPETNGYRVVDGVTDISILYRYFNNHPEGVRSVVRWQGEGIFHLEFF